MRRYKTPEQLKAWRERQEEIDAKRQADRIAHEEAMQKWADENCTAGIAIRCPDGIVRRRSVDVAFARLKAEYPEVIRWA